MRFSRLPLVVITLLTIFSFRSNAQELPASERGAKNKTDQSANTLPEFVIEVNRSGACLVAPISPRTRNGYLLYALPRPPQFPATDSAGRPTASKVFVSAQQRDGQWQVRVSIGTGEFYDAGDTKVGEFALGLNQRATVPDVNRFGLAPITVGVVKIIRSDASAPQINNETISVAVESVETKELPDPFTVRLKNTSNSDLVAIQYNKFNRYQFLELKWLSDGLINPLIKVGKTYELKVSSEDNSCGDAEGYRPNQSNRVDLVSAVYADGTIEGQTGLGALIKGAALGNRKHLEHVLEALRLVGNEPSALANELNNLQLSMNEDAAYEFVDELRMILPPMPFDATPSLNSFIRAGMHDVKVNLERDAGYYINILSSRNNPELSKQWAERTLTKYERWFEAAQRITSK